MEFRLITDWEALSAWSEDWDLLAGDDPFRSLSWLQTWWQTYGSDHELFVLLAINDGRAVGIAPWYQTVSLSQGRVIRWLGSGEVCTDYIGVMCDEAHREEAARGFAEWLAKPTQPWDLLLLDTVHDDDVATGRFIDLLREQQHAVDLRSGMNCWRIELPSTWDELMQRMSKSHRKQLRRVERRLLDSGEAQLHTATTSAEMEEAMTILVDLHQRRRQTLGQPGCFASPRFSEFLHTAAERLLADNRLKLNWVSLQGKPVAAEFQIEGGGTTYCYQAGIEPDEIEAEPGRLIMIATIRKAIQDGQTAIDFLRGDEPYKAHWRADMRTTTDIRVVSRKASARIRHRVWRVGDTLKQWLKSTLVNTDADK